jgi:hypothetical protein
MLGVDWELEPTKTNLDPDAELLLSAPAVLTAEQELLASESTGASVLMMTWLPVLDRRFRNCIKSKD